VDFAPILVQVVAYRGIAFPKAALKVMLLKFIRHFPATPLPSHATFQPRHFPAN
jgi:hypothetical protein